MFCKTFEIDIVKTKPRQDVPVDVSLAATPLNKYHSAVPDENSAFKIFACTSLNLDCEQIFSILSNISYLIHLGVSQSEVICITAYGKFSTCVTP